MKKQVITLLLFTISLSSYSQKVSNIKTAGPCSQEIVDNIKGSWINPVKAGKSKPEQLNRFNEIQKLMLEVYPTPLGAVAGWSATFQKLSFANKIRFVKNQEGRVDEEQVSNNPVTSLWYHVILYPYYCKGKNEIKNLYPEISGGVGFGIESNHLTIASRPPQDYRREEALIDGRPILLRMPLVTQSAGCEVLCTECSPYLPASSRYYILIHRPGELPYIPVTRKQYLGAAIRYFNNFYDEAIAGFNQIADNQIDKQTKQETIKATEKDKAEILKRYNDELTRTTKEDLLDAPAIVQGIFEMTQGPVFMKESEGGQMLVTENPKYMRKDLPKYASQFFVMEWSWNKDAYGQLFKKAMENFPIEKLQAMIDK